jgi:hypothetical protein
MRTLPNTSRASLAVGLALLALVVFLPACTHQKVVQLGTHKVTLSRHGFEKKFHVVENAPVPTLEYSGMSADRRALKVSIEGDKVTVNGVVGMLRAGDSVLIGDDGVAVNSLDYGESERYLRGNKAPADVTASN